MNVNQINKEYNHIISLLEKDYISSAIEAIGNLMNQGKEFTLADELEDYKKTYSLLLRYFVEGLPDDKRNDVADSVKSKLFSINERLNYRLLLRFSDSIYFSYARKDNSNSSSLTQLISNYEAASSKVEISEASNVYSKKLNADLQESIYSIFNKLWTSQFLDKDTADIIASILSRESRNDFDTILQCALVSALYMGTMAYYDPSKVKLLITAILSNRVNEVLARAYVFLVLLLARYEKKISDDRKIMSLLSLATDNDGFHKILICLITSYIRSVDTERINKTIAEEILPSIIKMRPEIEKSFRELEKDLSAEGSDYNPNWEDALKNSGLEERMKELNDLQMEGGDMFMLAFAGMKKQPFFLNPANWLLPFSVNHTEIKESVDKLPKGFIEMVTKSRLFCDSDCYSLFMGLKMMPEDWMKRTTSQLEGQISQFEDDLSSSFSKSSTPDIEVFIQRFFKDLYRFYNQYQFANEFFNPFKDSIRFINLPKIGDFIDNFEDLDLLANIYFHKNMWKECIAAIEKLEILYSENHNDLEGNNSVTDVKMASYLEFKGYAYLKIKKYSEAVDTYLLSLNYQEPSVWILSQIADCYRKLSDSGKYGEWLDKALSLENDNRRLLLKRSRLYIQEGRFDEAVKILYKLYYLDPENLHYIRTLAWCRCLENEPLKAMELYSSIPEDERNESDILNLAHCLFASHQYKEAVIYYCKYLKLKGINDFISALKEDTSSLRFLADAKERLSWIRDAAISSFTENSKDIF